MRRSRWIYLISGVLFVAFISLVTVVRFQSSARVQAEQGENHLREEFRTETREVSLRAYSSGSTRTELQSSMSKVLARFDAKGAIDLAILRLDLLFDPDFDVWLTHVQESTQSGISGIPTQGDDLRDAWERSMEPYADALIDADGVWIEAVDPNRQFPETQPGTLVIRNNYNLSANYQLGKISTSQKMAKAIEVFIPARVRDKNGEHVDVTISIVFMEPDARSPWQEVAMYVYLGGNGMGRELVLPSF